MEFLNELANGNYMPHGHCFLWREDLLLMHVGGDIATAAAYFAIPAALVKLVHSRTDLAFNWIFLMFALFIFFCGVTHLIDSINIWHGYYHVEGVAKMLTATVSLVTAVLVWRLLPKALAVPSHQDLLAKNRELSQLKFELETSNRELETSNYELENRVAERTNELQLLASTDPLTGLANRRELMLSLEQELSRAQRYRHEVVVLMLDIDNFKKLNDQYGHQTGDAVLQVVAGVFSAQCRASDTVGRYGGEEFVVLMPETTRAEAVAFSERLLQAVRASEVSTDDVKIAITCSIGIAAAQDGDTIDDLINRADKAMYEAKSGGKDRAVVAPTQAHKGGD